VHVGADHAGLADSGAVADQDEIADARAFADAGVIRNDAVLTDDEHHNRNLGEDAALKAGPGQQGSWAEWNIRKRRANPSKYHRCVHGTGPRHSLCAVTRHNWRTRPDRDLMMALSASNSANAAACCRASALYSGRCSRNQDARNRASASL